MKSSAKHLNPRKHHSAPQKVAGDKARKIRRLAEFAPQTTGDPYLDIAYAQLDNIRMWYRMFAAKKPVMLYDIQEQLIYAYPYREFKADLSQRSQATLEDQYRRAVADNRMVVFVRDNEQRRLVSYSFDIEEK
jgi:hypothetical protein